MYVFRRISNYNIKHGVCITILISYAKILFRAVHRHTRYDSWRLDFVSDILRRSSSYYFNRLRNFLTNPQKLSIIFILIWKVSGTHLQDAVVLGVVTPTANFPA